MDLAFLDIEMGRVSGFDVCEKLLALNPTTNVIYLTAFPDYALKAWNTGARGFLVKPLDAKELAIQLEWLKISLPSREQDRQNKPEA